ncbi:YlxM family DNA-binding protein [Peptococcus simiae]|uniref:UPF0122 protein ACKQTC_01895 n=1 Tax=Peptococcus simiae TaxID=1643805 RepID=A0ABW9GY67_9FIRM
MRESLGHLTYITQLFDLYSNLLTKHQRHVFALYNEEDLSLAEIAETTQTSRQAVHNTLQRVEGLLDEYEDKLGLAKKEGLQQAYFNRLQELVEGLAAGDRKHLDEAMEILSILKGGQNDGI